MDIAIIGTGFIGTTLGRALADSGEQVTFGSRHPDDDRVDVPGARVAAIGDAMAGADAIILAIPGAAVAELAATHGADLAGKLVIDATNRMGEPVANGRALLPPTIRYARAFNTLGGENFADPVFSDGRADMFFSAPVDDRQAVEEVIEGVGLRPVYVGEDQEAIIDALFRLWIALALEQGRGRRLALRLMEN
ncbi:MAG: NAD(P)-binding domain-containing protein [Acidimicrobiales bacterium]